MTRFIAAVLAVAFSAVAHAEDHPLEALQWRNIGPANMSGRIVDLAVVESNPSTYYVASASGGILKTTNNGTTFKHLFDREETVSIGSLDVSDSNPDIIWVGTGEHNPRNSVSYGNGVYKSTDAGETWTHMGLDETFQIGRVVIHPTDPDTVYVGALGRLWGHNEERGLYKTTDAGETWDRVLYIDDKTGIIDIKMHPEDHDTLLVASYERQRDEFDTNDPAKRWGPGSALYRTTDAGETFQKITDGLPSGQLGRMSLDYYREDPDIVYALIESEQIGLGGPLIEDKGGFMGLNGADADAGARVESVEEEGPAATGGMEAEDIVLAVNGQRVLSYLDLVNHIRAHAPGDVLEVEVSRDRQLFQLEVTLGERPEGQEAGEQQRPYGTFLGGQVANVQDRQGENGHEHGGVFKSTDAGETWTRINSLNPRPMYFSKIYADPNDDKNLYVLGVSLHKSDDNGEKFTGDGGAGGVHVDHHALWINPNDSNHIMLGNDGGLYVTYDRMKTWNHLNKFCIAQFYHASTDAEPLYKVYGGLQDNGSWGAPAVSRTSGGPINEDWVRVGGGDGFLCLVDRDDPDLVYYESQNGGLGRRNLRTGESGFLRPRPPEGTSYRWNWRTPFHLSHHNTKIYYTAGNYVFRSLDRGNDLRSISPEITVTDKGSATAFAESPINPDILYVGTDDGGVWMTLNAGNDWIDLWDPQEDEAEVPAEGAERRRGPRGDRPRGEGRGRRPGGPTDAERAARRQEAAPPEPEQAPAEASSPDPMSGKWNAQIAADQVPGEGKFEMTFTLDSDGKLSGRVVSQYLDGALEKADFNADVGLATFSVAGEMGQVDFRTRLTGENELEGTIEIADAGMAIDFTAARDAPEPSEAAQAEESPGLTLANILPGRRWVSSIDASRAEEGRVYISFLGHKSNDDAPYVLVSEDHGKTWVSIADGLPETSTRAIREDIENPNLLYLGHEFGIHATSDRGKTWTDLHTNLPTVAVHEVAQHPTRGDIVAATHGRGIWILDASALRQMTPEAMRSDGHLFDPSDVYRVSRRPAPGQTGLHRFVGQTTSGASFYYTLEDGGRNASIRVSDAAGETVRSLEGDAGKGVHRVGWDLRTDSREIERRGRTRTIPGRPVPTGTYTATLILDGRDMMSQDIEIHPDPEAN